MALTRTLDLPPLFRLVALREVNNAMAHAMRIAATEGAGTLVHVGRFDLVEFAVVLEPDEPLRTARRAVYAGAVALADALAALAPPEKPITFDWPDSVRIDGGLAGGVQLHWPIGVDENSPAPWLVFGGMLRTAALGEEEPGLRPSSSTLEDEGFDDLDSGRLVEGFARHFMSIIDTWRNGSFAEIARSYLTRLAPATERYSKGERREIDENGDLLVHRMGLKTPTRYSLVKALRQASWLDPSSGMPR